MSEFLVDRIRQQAELSAEAIALIGENSCLSYAELMHEVDALAAELLEKKFRVVALYADNSIDWVVFDLACLQACICFIPLPTFFSSQQIIHTFESASVDAVFTDQAVALNNKLGSQFVFSPMLSNSYEGCLLGNSELSHQNISYPSATRKITFTSGSTGSPKGVCLSEKNTFNVANSLRQVIELKEAKHLSLLPLSTLLENVAGVYRALLSGGSVVLLSSKETGLMGSSSLNVTALLSVIERHQPNTLILIPQLLDVLLAAIDEGWQAPNSLSFIAVGGAKVSVSQLNKAVNVGLPVYEGYGLSECASVVALNTPNENQLGSVGKILLHLKVNEASSEIIVSGNAFLGYLGMPDTWSVSMVKTGDLGRINNGYLSIDGRIKNQIISSYGRNISPEWVESEVLANHQIQQCVLAGEARPFCVALLYADMENNADNAAIIQAWIDSVNEKLPDYARIKAWYLMECALSFEQGFVTSNGRIKRDLVLAKYTNEIQKLYGSEDEK